MHNVFLWTHPSGYLTESLAALARTPGERVSLVCFKRDVLAPFAELAAGSDDVQLTEVPDSPSPQVVTDLVGCLSPDRLFVSGWHIRAYRRAARNVRPQAERVLCMDNQWLGTPKQQLGRLAFALNLRQVYDRVFVPGAPQAAFARRLGFPPEAISTGLLVCDLDTFVPDARTRQDASAPNFVFVGRLVAEKGVKSLLEAYRRYRARVSSPWPLDVFGEGPLRAELAGVPGVTVHGFTQPPQLAAKLQASGVFVLPSVFEPWGVVVQEAAAAGRPLILTDAVGAASAFLHEGRNGWLVPAGNSTSLAAALEAATRCSPQARAAMSDKSIALAKRVDHASWVAAARGLAVAS